MAIEKLGPAKARELLDKARNDITNIDELSDYCSDVIMNLCKSGYTNEAWELIERSAGQVRNFQISKFIEHAELSNGEIYQKILQLYDKKEWQMGVNALLRRFEIDQLDNLLGSAEFRDFTLRAKSAGLSDDQMRFAVSSRIQLGMVAAGLSSSAQRSIISSAINAYNNGLLNPVGAVDAIKRASALEPLEKFQSMRDFGLEGKNVSAVQEYRKSLINEMIKDNPLTAITQIMGVAGPQGNADLSNAVKSWALLDSASSLAWYQSNSPSIDPQKKDAAASGYFALAMEIGEYESARGWIEQIATPKMKASAAKALEETIKRNNGLRGQKQDTQR